MSDPTLQSRLDDAAREIERLASECAAQRAELVRLREELRLERALREDAEHYIELQTQSQNRIEAELADLRRLRTVQMLWPEKLPSIKDAKLNLQALRDSAGPAREKLAQLAPHERAAVEHVHAAATSNWPEYRAESNPK